MQSNIVIRRETLHSPRLLLGHFRPGVAQQRPSSSVTYDPIFQHTVSCCLAALVRVTVAETSSAAVLFNWFSSAYNERLM